MIKSRRLKEVFPLNKIRSMFYMGEMHYPLILSTLAAVLALTYYLYLGLLSSQNMLSYVLAALFAPSIFFVLFHLLYDLYLIFRSKAFAPLDTAAFREYCPKVTVMMPVYNEPAELVEKTLNSLKKLDYANLEILVADESEPDYAQEISKVCEREGVKFAHKQKDGKGFNAGALRFGVENASGEIVGIVDSDYHVDPQWLKKAIPYFGYEQVGVVNCPQHYSNHDHHVARIVGSFREQGRLKDLARYADGALTSSATMILIRKDIFRKYFTGDYMTEDFAFSVRMLFDGRLTFYIPDVLGEGVGPTNVKHYAKQQMRWLDNFRIFLDFLPKILKLPKVKVLHLFYHSTQFLYVIPVYNLLLLGIISGFLEPSLAYAALMVFLLIEVQKFLFIKSVSQYLKLRDFPAFIYIGLYMYPYLLYEFANILYGGKVAFFRTPK